ncbi:MAG: ATP-dependent Clp protease ATP-binding subunit ClpA, partial [Deltaproteobacteria bacterium]|nr:ATP-dependent Clp protease ATP-binding subunit ClpA [Deltaproteobacteria bacterium]
MISRKSEEVLNRAGRYAIDNRHEYCTLEHVFWALLDDPAVVDILDACDVDPEILSEELEDYMDREVPKLEATTADGSPGADDEQPPIVTVAVQSLLQRALFHVQSSGKDEVQPRDLFVALFQARDSQSVFLLGKFGIERLEVLNFISHGTLRDDQSPVPTGSGGRDRDRDDAESGARPKKEADALDTYA